MPVITRELIMQGRSDAGGWNRAQLKAFGIGWPLKPGWISRSLGRGITDKQIERFLAVKGEAGKVSKPRKVCLSTTNPSEAA